MNSPLQPVITLPPARPGPFPGSRRALLLPYLSGGAVPGAASCAMCRPGLEHWAGRRHISGCRSAPGIWHSSSMKSGLLLLPVLLALWAELSPASGQLRQAGNVCQLPPEEGPCKAYMPSYFYNPITESCEMFIYGGCGGNGNRFETKEECLWTCGQPEICKLPKEPGPCLAYMPRYFYDRVTKTCQMFIYGGCQGNGNRFATKEECLRTCGRSAGDVCQLPVKPGPCEAYMPHYFYNPASKSCERFIYGGCGGNGNRFATEEECLRACGQTEICKLPKEPGPCLAYMPRYFYDPVTKSCQMFIYGGCQGNGNRFATKEECLRTCGRSAGDVCQLPAKPGPCEAYMPHYFYNPASKSCERFIYGGCGGNGNRFATEEECLRACGQTAGDVCQLPANPGPCEAYMPHYFYNPASKSCKRFIYGGCGGNGNRFATEEECLRACGQTGPPFPQGQPEMD
ncbi:actinia tenebrosa protease inhibitors-like isoform X2 [Pelodiscus sinensis]|uniref:actinia tenebrosa protease inhibitors-like isoform X2 n=1 Tax=Pelodiscus sinensis TaxID=13735 RepID=UPI003F6AFBE5